ncbi:hypothetical protein XcvCFBP7112P_11485 [Xanthomonas citri pv. vignicola]|nr:hypothetical protein XcvCFBP7112P_11485 [Xanthomonas citri pv. vignicola]
MIGRLSADWPEDGTTREGLESAAKLAAVAMANAHLRARSCAQVSWLNNTATGRRWMSKAEVLVQRLKEKGQPKREDYQAALGCLDEAVCEAIAVGQTQAGRMAGPCVGYATYVRVGRDSCKKQPKVS